MTNSVLDNTPANKGIHFFRRKIMRWFDNNQRVYPWRQTRDPFRVLIAEMMLRRTKADQVREVYNSLFKQYPDIESIAEAPEDELERILYPLGLKWRTPAFRLVARVIREKYDCQVPRTREELISLPGVGDYVAGAVLSIGYGKAEWMVDSNIVRVLKRYFGINTSKEGRRDKHVVETAKIYVMEGDPRKANLAILDFAAMVCLPGNPRCAKCPLSDGCRIARSHGG